MISVFQPSAMMSDFNKRCLSEPQHDSFYFYNITEKELLQTKGMSPLYEGRDSDVLLKITTFNADTLK